MIDANRNVQGDDADEADEIITVMVDKGDATTTDANAELLRVGAIGASALKLMVAAGRAVTDTNRNEVLAAIPQLNATVADSFIDSVRIDNKPDHNDVSAAVAGNTDKLRFVYETTINFTPKADTLAALGGAPRFAVRLAAKPANADTLAIWNAHLDFVRDKVKELRRLTGAGSRAFAVMVVSTRAIAGNTINEKGDILVKMVRVDDGTAIGEIATNADADNLLNATLYRANLLADLNKIAQNLDDAVMGCFGEWAISHFADDVADGLGGNVPIANVFQAEYARVTRAGAPRAAMHNAVFARAYDMGMYYALQQAKQHLDDGNPANAGNDITAAIDALAGELHLLRLWRYLIE